MSRQTSPIALRAGTLADGNAIVRLNSESVIATSSMDEQEFERLYELSSLLLVAERDGVVVGFLMGFNDGVELDGLNYQWFVSRLKGFFYVDRIVIDESCRGRGVGQQIYARISEWARDQHLLWLAAEMNLDPPNLASLRFHKRQGFLEIGTLKLPSGKLVSMQIKRLG